MDRSVRARISVVMDDITRLHVDGIVNAANESLLGGRGVDGAIHRAAGPRLLDACRALGGCPVGQARITSGYDLPARYVIHAVGPIWRGGGHGEAGLLASAYRSSLALAAGHEIEAIAFPAISCGAYGYPVDAAAAIAFDTITEHLAQNAVPGQVVLACFDPAIADAYRRLLEDDFREGAAAP